MFKFIILILMIVALFFLVVLIGRTLIQIAEENKEYDIIDQEDEV